MKSLTLNGKKYDCFVDPVARKSGGGVAKIEVLDSDPIGEDLTEGRIWILKTSAENLTIPVIELGTVGEKSIEIKLSNASFDGSGAAVKSYNIYVNGVLNKTAYIVAGGTYAVTGLSPETEYQISVCGVSGSVLSAMSNTLTAETLTASEHFVPDYVILARTHVYYDSNTSSGAQMSGRTSRSCALWTEGEMAVPPLVNGVQYYLIAVPETVTECTVVCPGLMWTFAGWVSNGKGGAQYVHDSGYLESGTTFAFDAGAVKYMNIAFKKGSEGVGEFTENDELLSGITITLA